SSSSSCSSCDVSPLSSSLSLSLPRVREGALANLLCSCVCDCVEEQKRLQVYEEEEKERRKVRVRIEMEMEMEDEDDVIPPEEIEREWKRREEERKREEDEDKDKYSLPILPPLPSQTILSIVSGYYLHLYERVKRETQRKMIQPADLSGVESDSYSPGSEEEQSLCGYGVIPILLKHLSLEFNLSFIDPIQRILTWKSLEQCSSGVSSVVESIFSLFSPIHGCEESVLCVPPSKMLPIDIHSRTLSSFIVLCSCQRDEQDGTETTDSSTADNAASDGFNNSEHSFSDEHSESGGWALPSNTMVKNNKAISDNKHPFLSSSFSSSELFTEFLYGCCERNRTDIISYFFNIIPFITISALADIALSPASIPIIFLPKPHSSAPLCALFMLPEMLTSLPSKYVRSQLFPFLPTVFSLCVCLDLYGKRLLKRKEKEEKIAHRKWVERSRSRPKGYKDATVSALDDDTLDATSRYLPRTVSPGPNKAAAMMAASETEFSESLSSIPNSQIHSLAVCVLAVLCGIVSGGCDCESECMVEKDKRIVFQVKEIGEICRECLSEDPDGDKSNVLREIMCENVCNSIVVHLYEGIKECVLETKPKELVFSSSNEDANFTLEIEELIDIISRFDPTFHTSLARNCLEISLNMCDMAHLSGKSSRTNTPSGQLAVSVCLPSSPVKNPASSSTSGSQIGTPGPVHGSLNSIYSSSLFISICRCISIAGCAVSSCCTVNSQSLLVLLSPLSSLLVKSFSLSPHLIPLSCITVFYLGICCSFCAYSIEVSDSLCLSHLAHGFHTLLATCLCTSTFESNNDMNKLACISMHSCSCVCASMNEDVAKEIDGEWKKKSIQNDEEERKWRKESEMNDKDTLVDKERLGSSRTSSITSNPSSSPLPLSRMFIHNPLPLVTHLVILSSRPATCTAAQCLIVNMFLRFRFFLFSPTLNHGNSVYASLCLVLMSIMPTLTHSIAAKRWIGSERRPEEKGGTNSVGYRPQFSLGLGEGGLFPHCDDEEDLYTFIPLPEMFYSCGLKSDATAGQSHGKEAHPYLQAFDTSISPSMMYSSSEKQTPPFIMSARDTMCMINFIKGLAENDLSRLTSSGNPNIAQCLQSLKQDLFSCEKVLSPVCDDVPERQIAEENTQPDLLMSNFLDICVRIGEKQGIFICLKDMNEKDGGFLGSSLQSFSLIPSSSSPTPYSSEYGTNTHSTSGPSSSCVCMISFLLWYLFSLSDPSHHDHIRTCGVWCCAHMFRMERVLVHLSSSKITYSTTSATSPMPRSVDKEKFSGMLLPPHPNTHCSSVPSLNISSHMPTLQHSFELLRAILSLPHCSSDWGIGGHVLLPSVQSSFDPYFSLTLAFSYLHSVSLGGTRFTILSQLEREIEEMNKISSEKVLKDDEEYPKLTSGESKVSFNSVHSNVTDL
ncbi:hypothetical protein ADUPG1_009014, partial [Aduncisulcus paluster]